MEEEVETTEEEAYEEEDWEDDEEKEEPQLYVRGGDKDVVDIFHTQSENAKKQLKTKINEFNKWINEREGLKDLPNVRMALEIHNQIINVMMCLIREARILQKIKNQSITYVRNEKEKAKTKYEKKIKALEERIEKLKEKEKTILKPHQIEICKRIVAGETQVDLAKKLKLNRDTLVRWYRIYKKMPKNTSQQEKPKNNIEDLKKT